MISICPKCAGKISLPEDVDRQANCECPLCQARYSVAEVFRQVAPEVTVFYKQTGDENELSFAPSAAEPRLFTTADGDGPDEDAESEVASVLDGQASSASFDVELTPCGDDELAEDNVETGSNADVVDPILGGAAAFRSMATTATEAKSHSSNQADDAVVAIDKSADDVVESDEIDDVDDKLAGLADIGMDDAESVADLVASDETADELGLDTEDFIELQEDDAFAAADPLAAADALTADGDVGRVADEEESVGGESVKANGADDAMSVNKAPKKSPIEVVKPFDFKPSPGQMPARHFSPRVPRRSRNILSDIVKFGLGGILGLLLCQVGLWWIGRFDPLGFAPKLPDAVSFLAPKSLRSSNVALGAADQAFPMRNDNQGTSATPPIEPLPPPESYFEAEETELLNENRASAFPENETTERAGGGQSGEQQPAGSVAPLPNAESIDRFFSESAAEPPDVVDSGDLFETGDRDETGEPSADSAGDVDNIGDAFIETVSKLGLIAEPKYSRDDVRGALESTRNTRDALYAAVAAKSDVTERKALLTNLYDEASDLAERAAYAAPGCELVLQEVHDFVSETSAIAVTIGKIAARRLPGSTQTGVFLAGTVGDTISKDAQYQRLQLTLLGDSPQVFDLLTPATNDVASGDKVFVLGVRVQPALEIGGYTSADEGTVVWTDHIVPIAR